MRRVKQQNNKTMGPEVPCRYLIFEPAVQVGVLSDSYSYVLLLCYEACTTSWNVKLPIKKEWLKDKRRLSYNSGTPSDAFNIASSPLKCNYFPLQKKMLFSGPTFREVLIRIISLLLECRIESWCACCIPDTRDERPVPIVRSDIIVDQLLFEISRSDAPVLL